MASSTGDYSPGNGMTMEMPPERKQMVENSISEYVTQYHQVAAQRDALVKENLELRANLAERNAMLEIAELTASQLQSKMDVAASVRDEAVVRRASVEAVLQSIMALGRAFDIQNEPLIKEVADAEAPAASPTGVATGDIL